MQVLEGLPIGAGVLSEEGSECTNKIFRFNRLHHARQSDVELNLLDCFTRSHYQADPRIQLIFNKERRQERSKAHSKPYSAAALAIMETPQEELQPPEPVEKMDCN